MVNFVPVRTNGNLTLCKCTLSDRLFIFETVFWALAHRHICKKWKEWKCHLNACFVVAVDGKQKKSIKD